MKKKSHPLATAIVKVLEFACDEHWEPAAQNTHKAKPCPSCGYGFIDFYDYGGWTGERWWQCQCGNCQMTGPAHSGRKVAVAAWNKLPRRKRKKKGRT